jgi:hypothetical protein
VADSDARGFLPKSVLSKEALAEFV